MTYEEYKDSKKVKKNNFLKSLLSKLFTVVIFTMIVIIVSNLNVDFRNFLINDVLNNSMDFSKVNNILDSFTNVFKNNNTQTVFKEENKSEKYKDGTKYYVNTNSNIYLKDSGIVTYIGSNDDYLRYIVIQQSNGKYALYGNIDESIKLYDYVESGEEIGKSVSDFYYYVLYDDDSKLSND